MKRKLKVAMINSDWNNEYRAKHNLMGGVGYYRLWLPKLALEKVTNWKVDMIGTEFQSMIDETSQETILKSYVQFFKKYDVVILKHFDNPNAGRYLMAASEYTKVPIITDLDDDVFSVRDDQPAAELGYKKGELKRATVATMLSFSKAIFATNDYLGKRVTNHIKEACGVELPYYVLPNYNNLKDWKGKSRKTNYITIGWHGSITHNSDLEMVLPAIKGLMKKYNIRLELMGGVKKEFAIELFKDWDYDTLSRISLSAGTQAWRGFPYKLMRKTWDIGIAPLIDDEFNRCKSNIKWMEYAMKKIPTVASDVLPYQNIEHGKTGFLVKTPDEWYDTLETLILDAKLRKEIGENAYTEVATNWQYHQHGNLWKEAILSVVNSVLKSN